MQNNTSDFSFLCFSFQLVKLKIWHSCFPFTRVKMCGMWSKRENCSPLDEKTRRSVLRHQSHHLVTRAGQNGGLGGTTRWCRDQEIWSSWRSKAAWLQQYAAGWALVLVDDVQDQWLTPLGVTNCTFSFSVAKVSSTVELEQSLESISSSPQLTAARRLRQEWKILMDVNQFLLLTSKCVKSQEKGGSSCKIWSVAW